MLMCFFFDLVLCIFGSCLWTQDSCLWPTSLLFPKVFAGWLALAGGCQWPQMWESKWCKAAKPLYMIVYKLTLLFLLHFRTGFSKNHLKCPGGFLSILQHSSSCQAEKRGCFFLLPCCWRPGDQAKWRCLLIFLARSSCGLFFCVGKKALCKLTAISRRAFWLTAFSYVYVLRSFGS